MPSVAVIVVAEVEPATGPRSATHFVGCVPVAWTPDYPHASDGPIYVLDGDGMVYAGDCGPRLSTGGVLSSQRDRALPITQMRHARAKRHLQATPE
jgi:hypothetical protein